MSGPPPTSLSLELLELIPCHVGFHEVHKAVGFLLETLGPLPTGPHVQRGVVHEILFLTMTALGKDHANIVAFNKKSKSTFNKLAINKHKGGNNGHRCLPQRPPLMARNISDHLWSATDP